MALYPAGNPYEDNQRFTGGAVQNGTQGSQTPVSVQNAVQQQKSTDPYAAFGGLTDSWKQAVAGTARANVLSGYMQPRGNGAPPMHATALSAAYGSGTDVGSEPPPSDVAGGEQPQTAPPPDTTTPPPATAATNPPPGNRPTTPQTDPDPTQQQAAQKPQNISDQTWSIAQQWAQQAAEKGGNYSWLLQKPEAVDQYMDEAHKLEDLGVTGLHFTDWARARGYDSSIDSGTLKAPPAFAQMGGDDHSYETMVRWLADGSSKYGVDTMRDYAAQLQRSPGLISSYENEMQQAEQHGFTGIHFVDWLARQQGGFRSPLAGQMGQASSDAAHAWANFRETGHATDPAPVHPYNYGGGGDGAYVAGGDGSGGVNATATSGAGVGGAQTTAPPPVPPPHDPVLGDGSGAGGATYSTPPPPSAAPHAGAAGAITPDTRVPPDFDATTLRAANVDYLDPVYQDAMDQVRRQMMQAGAVSGSLNSGGFAPTLARSLAPIANQFAKEKGTIQFQAQQANADRILDKYKFDNADQLQRFLAENKNNLDKYGIDQNVILQKWVTENKAQLEREGYDVQKWIANLNAQTGLQSAQMGAAAAGASAAAGADAARYNADLDYKLGVSQLGYNYWNSDQGRQYDNTFNQRNYDLGVLGINRDVYGMDQTQMRYLLGLMNQQSPDARLGAIPLPGQMPY